MPKNKRKRPEASSWKKAKAVKKIFRKLKIMLFSVAVLMITGFSLWVASVVKLIKAPLASATNFDIVRLSNWSGDTTINIVTLNSKELGILRVNPEVNSYTYIQLDNVLNFKSFENVDINSINKNILKKYAVSGDRYLVTDEKGEEVAKLLFGDYRNAKSTEANYAKFFINFKSNIEASYSGIKTDFSLKEMFTLSNFIKNCDNGSILNYDKSGEFNSEIFDYSYQQILLSKTFREEGLSVMVLNGAEKTGFGWWGTRVAKNIGVNALDPQNSYATEKTSKIVYKSNKSETLDALSRAFNISELIGSEDLDKYSSYAQRADILVVIGLDKIADF